ncbi:MAG: undecaprenyldiphospho-muramoylpentapeptide beta-N-acetylglucosaminyltransferase [Acidimicrobiia bacterium]|nr:undecaprenyldiphospho-muramoylpentapeptide beta-N-acetylglucosaminyltransferase [Acidimicrobiia bacterium]NNC42969.1 undecaprenyldiphospho-muramoylpentapeptide beta-N-acetylglucosaminyltransferase [Acidimicrobiia bacterium]
MVIAIAAAGTGGHIFPALAVADVLRAGGHHVLFIGGDRLEATVVPEAGYPIVSVPTRGLTGNWKGNAGAIVDVARAARRFRGVIRNEGVDAVLAMGGYITGPAALAARLTRVPLILHEQNATAGTANRLASPFARRVLVAFRAATKDLRRGQVVGNPLRAEVLADVNRQEALSRYGIDPGLMVVGITGGSQGAQILNEAIVDLVTAWSHDPIAVVHIAGTRSELKPVPNPLVHHNVVAYEDEMAYFYAAADLVVSRAGALTVSELAATSSPAILVPYSFGSASHQAENAGILVGVGGAIALSQDQLNRLPAMVADLLGDPDSLSRVARAAGTLAVRDAAEQVAMIVLEEAARG